MSISSAEAHVNDDVTLTRRAFLACIADTDMFNRNLNIITHTKPETKGSIQCIHSVNFEKVAQ